MEGQTQSKFCAWRWICSEALNMANQHTPDSSLTRPPSAIELDDEQTHQSKKAKSLKLLKVESGIASLGNISYTFNLIMERLFGWLEAQYK